MCFSSFRLISFRVKVINAIISQSYKIYTFFKGINEKGVLNKCVLISKRSTSFTVIFHFIVSTRQHKQRLYAKMNKSRENEQIIDGFNNVENKQG